MTHRFHLRMCALTGVLFSLLFTAGPAPGLPNSVLGAVNRVKSPLDGRDLTGVFLHEAWQDGARLPGEWAEEGEVEDARISHLLARPVMFGQPLVLVRAIHRADALESIECTFADAGSHFGYLAAPGKDGPDAALSARQKEFATRYGEILEALETGLAAECGRAKPKEIGIGHTRQLRAKAREWQSGGRTIHLLADGTRLFLAPDRPHLAG